MLQTGRSTRGTAPKKGEDAESELVSVAEEVAWQLEERATELEELVDQNTIS